MPNIRLVIEYDGSKFSGWQQQPDVRTIQEELSRVITLVLRSSIGPLHAAGRTDAGVHARRQVVNFQCPEVPDLDRLKHSISRILRGEVSVLAIDVVPDRFNSRKDALRKQYTYKILNRITPPVLERGKVWHVSAELDIEKMKEGAGLLVGSHDFSSFRGTRCASKSPIKEIFESEIIVSPPYLVYRVVGSGFLKQMVRNIVGSLVAFGKGTNELPTMADLLAARDRRLAGVTAPGYGLTMDWVEYPAEYAFPAELDSLSKRRIIKGR